MKSIFYNNNDNDNNDNNNNNNNNNDSNDNNNFSHSYIYRFYISEINVNTESILYITCRTGVIFCVFDTNRRESEASAKRESRARGRARKNNVSRLPSHASVRQKYAKKYACCEG